MRGSVTRRSTDPTETRAGNVRTSDAMPNTLRSVTDLSKELPPPQWYVDGMGVEQREGDGT